MPATFGTRPSARCVTADATTTDQALPVPSNRRPTHPARLFDHPARQYHSFGSRTVPYYRDRGAFSAELPKAWRRGTIKTHSCYQGTWAPLITIINILTSARCFHQGPKSSLIGIRFGLIRAPLPTTDVGALHCHCPVPQPPLPLPVPLPPAQRSCRQSGANLSSAYAGSYRLRCHGFTQNSTNKLPKHPLSPQALAA